MKHCGNETCQGAGCANFDKCRGETIPPWTLFQFAPPTSKVSIWEQDVLAAADALAANVLAAEAAECLFCVQHRDAMNCTECAWSKIGILAADYQRERDGKR